MSASVLDALKQYTTVVADTGDFDAIVDFKPVDATTNPSLILAAAKLPQYAHLVERAVSHARDDLESANGVNTLAQRVLEYLTVFFGAEILKIVPGRVSTEVPAALSHDTDATIKEALAIIALYERINVDKNRILIKIASTWEGIQAAAVLEKQHGIHCNLTLLFNLTQAVACAEAGVTLVSPFVGRILDWHKRSTGNEYSAAEDPGVQSVKSIYNYFKKYGYSTVVMGASFRNVGEIEELAGVDFLTISPTLLKQLSERPGPLARKLSPAQAMASTQERITMTRGVFDEMMAADAMATELLADGIYKFDQDSQKLLDWLRDKLSDN